MKSTLKGQILSVKKTDGDAEITFQACGKVERSTGGVIAPSAREITLSGTTVMKAVIANEIKIGAIITITISDEESDERLD